MIISFIFVASYPNKFKHFREVSCPYQSSSLTISHKDFDFDSFNNATLILSLYSFTTPFVFQVHNYVYICCCNVNLLVSVCLNTAHVVLLLIVIFQLLFTNIIFHYYRLFCDRGKSWQEKSTCFESVSVSWNTAHAALLLFNRRLLLYVRQM